MKTRITILALTMSLLSFAQAKMELNGGVTDGKGMTIGANLHIPIGNDQELTLGYRERNTAQENDSRHVDISYNKYLFKGFMSGRLGFGGQWDNLREDINPFLTASVDFRVEQGVHIVLSHQEVFKMSTNKFNNIRNITLGVKIDLIFSKTKPKRFF